MPVYLAGGGVGIGTSGGGRAYGLGPPQNTFADDAARDTYATANAAWLAEYNANRGFWIRVGADLQRRNGAGDAWEDVTPVVQGRMGTAGAAGRDGANGGGAWASLGTHVHTANDHGANVFVDGGFDLPAGRSVYGARIGQAQSNLDENGGIVPLSGLLLATKATASAGDISAVASRIRVSEYGGGGFLNGNLYLGWTDTGRVLFATSNANQDFAIEVFDYIPSTAQGFDPAAVQALIDATPLANLQGQVTDGQVPAAIARDAEIGPAITAYAGAIAGLTLTEGQIPASIMRDAEFTAAAVRGLLGLTAAEANNLLTGASITNRVLSFPQNDGTTATITLPADSDTQDGVVASGAFNAGATELILTLDTGGTVSIPVPASLRMGGGGGVNEMRVNELIAAALTAAVTGNTETGITVTYNADGTLDFVVTGSGPTPHSLTRYAALRADGTMPADFTEANFLAAAATSSMTQDIDTPASDSDMVVGIAVPTSEGVLTGVAELDQNGMVNQFANMIRGDFIPAVGGTQVTLEIDGVDHYVYCTSSTVLAIFLGVIGYRLTQTSP